MGVHGRLLGTERRGGHQVRACECFQKSSRVCIFNARQKCVCTFLTKSSPSLFSYEAIINSCELGHGWLLSHLSTRPSSAWQIDPFGPSLANTHLFSLMGYDAMVHDRVGYEAKVRRERCWYELGVMKGVVINRECRSLFLSPSLPHFVF